MSRATHVENAPFEHAERPHSSAAVVEELHDPETGLLDAQRAARAMGISLVVLATALGSTPSKLANRPGAKPVQSALREIEFAIAGLRRLLGSDRRIVVWLNEPHPDLGGEPPINLLTKGSAWDFANFVRSALAGQPT